MMGECKAPTFPKKEIIYICGICGKEYSAVTERANCEIKCDATIKAEEKKKREEKLKQERESRKAQVEAAYKYAKELKEEYINDYPDGCWDFYDSGFRTISIKNPTGTSARDIDALFNSFLR